MTRRVRFINVVFTRCSTGYGHRRWHTRAIIYDQRGNHGRGRERQCAGNAEESVPVQNSRNAARARATDPGERHGRGDRGNGRNRRSA